MHQQVRGSCQTPTVSWAESHNIRLKQIQSPINLTCNLLCVRTSLTSFAVHMQQKRKRRGWQFWRDVSLAIHVTWHHAFNSKEKQFSAHYGYFYIGHFSLFLSGTEENECWKNQIECVLRYFPSFPQSVTLCDWTTKIQTTRNAALRVWALKSWMDTNQCRDFNLWLFQ